MKTIIKMLFLTLIAQVITGCYTYVPISKQLPPEINIENKKNEVGFINLYDYENLDFNNKNKIKVFQSGTQQFIHSLLESLNEDDRFHLTMVDTLSKGKAKSRLDKPLKQDTVVQLCKEYNLEYLLALEAYDIYFEKEIETVRDEDGSKNRIANFYLYVYAGISLYDSTGGTVNSSGNRIYKFYKSRENASLIIKVDPFIGLAGEDVDRLSDELGLEYMDKYNPGVLTETRSYYIGKEFHKTMPYIRNNDWEKVIELLSPLASSDDEKIKRKAANNLSVAYEALGDMEMAEKWKGIYNSLR